MGQTVCIDSKHHQAEKHEVNFSHGNSYRSDYFTNLKNKEHYNSIDIQKIRFAQIETFQHSSKNTQQSRSSKPFNV
jgi:hypothetical protein